LDCIIAELAVDLEGKVVGELKESTICCLPGVIDASRPRDSPDTPSAEAIKPDRRRSAMLSSIVEIDYAPWMVGHTLRKVGPVKREGLTSWFDREE